MHVKTCMSDFKGQFCSLFVLAILINSSSKINLNRLVLKAPVESLNYIKNSSKESFTERVS
jgi:hypothetical protein